MSLKLSIIHAIGGLNPQSGGTTRVVIDLTDVLVEQLSIDITLVSQSLASAITSPSTSEKVCRVIANSSSRYELQLGLPFRTALWSTRTQLGASLVHSHGVWMSTNYWTSRYARAFRLPLVLQPHGMLEPWALNHKAWKKKLAMALFQRRDLESAKVFIATSAMEYESIRAIGLRQPVAVIPNGVLFGALCAADAKAAIMRTDKIERVALFISRVHPKKGILNLLRAWAQVAPKGWRLKIAGPDEGGHLAEVMALANELDIAQEVEYIGSVDGQIKEQTYFAADLFILPSFSENFGLVVAEALAHRLPVITTRGTPWADLETYRCGWWIDIGIEPLVLALREAMMLSDDERRAMGERGRDYVRRYNWDDIAKQTIDVYYWVLGHGPRPDCVRTD